MDASDVVAGAKTFGFHGVFNMFLVENEDEIVAMAPMLSESIARSEMTGLLLENLLKFRQFGGAVALARRMLEINPENTYAADAALRAQCELDAHNASIMTKNRRGAAARILQKIRLG
jgi:hypothetical protein